MFRPFSEDALSLIKRAYEIAGEDESPTLCVRHIATALAEYEQARADEVGTPPPGSAAWL